MRLIAVSVVKNEADIIEAFVRHAAAWVDLHLILDDDSTDGTREILEALRAEGLALKLFGDDVIGHIQQARNQQLVRIAAETHAADWILPLDADEFLDGPGRDQLEHAFTEIESQTACSLPLLDYCVTTADDGDELNPVLRLRHCRPEVSTTRKLFIPRAAALDPGLAAGKGNHALYRGNVPQVTTALPPAWRLCHFALRSPQHQLLRVARAELQRLSRGQATEGLDVHYRLGYQLLAENPEKFFSTLDQSPNVMIEKPIRYRGSSLRHTTRTDWFRVARAFFPYLEQLARSHGRLADQAGYDVAAVDPTKLRIYELSNRMPAGLSRSPAREDFTGFTAISGWCRQEGPVPEAFLPVFHWGLGPATELEIYHDDATRGSVVLQADCLTYCDRQTLEVECNRESVARLEFTQINNRERLHVPLLLRPGSNRLVLRYSQALVTDHDPRALAVIFLSLRVSSSNPPA